MAPRLQAVITGDIVGSSRLDREERGWLHGHLQEASRQLRYTWSDIVPYHIDIFRGDSWQLLVAQPPRSLMVALYLRTFVRSGLASLRLDTRLAIGVGKVEGIPGGNVSSGHGEAFSLSGAALEGLVRGHRMTIALSKDIDRPSLSALDVVLKLVDALAQRWTPKQAFAVGKSLAGLTQEQIASEWLERHITQQAVAQHLDRAGWDSVRLAVSHFEGALETATWNKSQDL